MEEDFTTDNDLVTPKMSLKRRNVLAKYGSLLEGLYEEDTGASDRRPN